MPRLKKDASKLTEPQSPTPTTKAPPTKDLLKICKWAANNGAVRIRAFGVEIDFLPPDLGIPPMAERPDANKALPPNLEYLRERAAAGQTDPSEPPSVPEGHPAVRSLADDPDVFAHNSDIWANQTRLPRR